MGANPGMLSRQFLTEGVLLSLFGAALGLLPATGGPRLIVRLNAGSMPRAAETGVGRSVFLARRRCCIALGRPPPNL